MACLCDAYHAVDGVYRDSGIQRVLVFLSKIGMATVSMQKALSFIIQANLDTHSYRTLLRVPAASTFYMLTIWTCWNEYHAQRSVSTAALLQG